MIIRPVINVPLPWLTILFARIYGARRGKPQEKRDVKYLFPRTLKVTKLGKWYIAILLLIGIAAINTENNLLYLIVGMLLSLIIISGIMSESTLRGLKVKRTLPGQIFAGREFLARIEIRNTKKVLPSFSFALRELSVPGLDSNDSYVLKLKNGEKVTRHNNLIFNKRAVVTLRGLMITTSFPFSLFIKGKREKADLTLTVYPRLCPAPIKELERLNSLNRIAHTKENTTAKGDGIDLHSLKKYVPGDDSRRIDWKSSARSRVLLTKEFEREEEIRVVIDFDNTTEDSTAGEEYFEHCVSLAAGLACHLIERGFYVGLKTREARFECKSGKSHLFSLLDALALIEPDKTCTTSRRPSVRVTER